MATDNALNSSIDEKIGGLGPDQILGRQRPPYAFDAEKGILCSILIDAEAIEIVKSEGLVADDFHHPQHQMIFSAISDLYEKNEPIDTVTVANELLKNGTFDKVGAHTLSLIEEFLPTSAAVGSYTRLVKDKSILRRLIGEAKNITELAYSGHKDVSMIIDEAESSILSIRESTSKKNIISLKDLSTIALKRYQEMIENKQSVTGISSGFHDLDNKTAGFQKGEFIVVAARPSMGKTAFTLNMAAHIVLEEQMGVAFFSLEMGAEQLFSRLIGSFAEIDLAKLRSGHVTQDDIEKITDATAYFANAPLYIDESPTLTIGDLRNKARRLVHQYGVQIIMVDYLQLMSAPMRFENKAVEVGEISKGLKNIARELKVPVIALSQLNRGVESRTDKRPMMSDLRESGAIEQDADLIAFLYREEYYLRDKTPNDKKNIAELIIGKNRNGPTGQINLRFDNKYTRFSNLSMHEP